MRSTFTFRPALGAMLLLGLTMASGCSKQDANQVPVHPVSGQVLFNGKPAAGALLAFHPTQREGQPIIPVAQTDAQGNYALTTYASGDGAPEGDYRVTVTLRPLVLKNGDYIEGPNQLPPHAAKPETTRIQVQVAAGANSLPITITR